MKKKISFIIVLICSYLIINKYISIDTDPCDITCDNCGSKYFRQVTAFKRISALMSPTGKEQIVPVPTYRCDDCGYINEEFRPIAGKEDK